MALMAGSRSRSLMLVIQRMRSCSSGVARVRRDFARPRAAESGMLPSEASESAAGIAEGAVHDVVFILVQRELDEFARFLRAGGDRDAAKELLLRDWSDPRGGACVARLGDFDAGRGVLRPGRAAQERREDQKKNAH